MNSESEQYLSRIKYEKTKQALEALAKLNITTPTLNFSGSEVTSDIIRMPINDAFLVIRYSTRPYSQSDSEGSLYVTYESHGSSYPSTQRQLFRVGQEGLNEATTNLLIRLHNKYPDKSGSGSELVRLFIKKIENADAVLASNIYKWLKE